jgi:hypothetical protein
MTIYKYQKGRIFQSRAVTKALKIHSKSPSNPSETQREDISSAQRWAVGLIDGDGHMSISWSNSNKTKWVPLLKVSLHIYNQRAIYKLKTILKCGQITRHKNMITLRVTKRQLWYDHLIVLFDNMPLRSDKFYDYITVKKMLFLEQTWFLNPPLSLSCNRNLLIHEVQSLVCQAKSNGRECQVSPIVMLALRNDAPLRILDRDWLAGFVEADGSFYILANGQHGFALGQANNKMLVYLIHSALAIQSKLKVRPDYVMLDTRNRSTLINLLPVFHHGFLGVKSFEFTVWYRTLIKNDKDKSLKAKQILNTIRKRI